MMNISKWWLSAVLLHGGFFPETVRSDDQIELKKVALPCRGLVLALADSTSKDDQRLKLLLETLASETDAEVRSRILFEIGHDRLFSTVDEGMSFNRLKQSLVKSSVISGHHPPKNTLMEVPIDLEVLAEKSLFLNVATKGINTFLLDEAASRGDIDHICLIQCAMYAPSHQLVWQTLAMQTMGTDHFVVEESLRSVSDVNGANEFIIACHYASTNNLEKAGDALSLAAKMPRCYIERPTVKWEDTGVVIKGVDAERVGLEGEIATSECLESIELFREYRVPRNYFHDLIRMVEKLPTPDRRNVAASLCIISARIMADPDATLPSVSMAQHLFQSLRGHCEPLNSSPASELFVQIDSYRDSYRSDRIRSFLKSCGSDVARHGVSPRKVEATLLKECLDDSRITLATINLAADSLIGSGGTPEEAPQPEEK